MSFMTIKQLSVFVENRRGRMAKITEILANHNIDLRAITLADTNEFGLVRIIVSDPDRALDVLREAGIMVRSSEAVAVGVKDSPGEFSKALRLIADAGVSIEYLFTIASPKDGEAVIIMRMDQPGDGIAALRNSSFRIIAQEEI
jgi:hypothetical protein